MKDTAIRKLWMNQAIHDALAELAYQTRESVSDILRDILRDIIKNPQPTWIERTEDLPGPMQRSVSVVVENDLWMNARDASWPTRISLAKQVRLRVVRRAGAQGIPVAA